MMKAIAAALVAVVSVSTAAATEPRSPLAKDQVVLELRNIDLATVDGQRRLAIRMDQAARAVCGDRLATVHLDLEAQSRACQADVVADIRSRIEARTADAGHAAATPVLLALR